MGQRNDAARLRGAIDTAVAELARLALSPQTTDATTQAWERFAAFATRGGGRSISGLTPEVVGRFVGARHVNGERPSVATMHWRRSAVRLLFRIWRDLGLAEWDPTLDLRLPSRSSMPSRPLTDDEVAVCRWAALATATETRLPAVWALAEAGATTSEIPVARSSDIDFDASTVSLAGSTKTDPRIVPLTDWGAVQFRRRIAMLGSDPAAVLVYEGAGRPESAQASVSGAIGDVLRRAGLGDEPDVRPRSVTAWVGQTVFEETGRIEAVARRLGMRSLDRAAALIGWDWHNP